MPRSFLILFAVIAVFIAGAAAGAVRLGWFNGRPDPMVVAEQKMRAGNLRDAQFEMRTALRDHPKDAGTHLRMAELQLRLGDAVAAEKELKTARDLGADQWAVWPKLGQAYLEQGKFAAIIAEVPDSGPSGEMTAQLLALRGTAQIGLKDVGAAEAARAAAERAAPGAEVSLLGARIGIAKRDMVAAEASVDAALKQDPAQVDALMLKARLLLSRRDIAGAMGMADRAVAAAPWAMGARLERANMLLTRGDDAKAREDVDAVLRLQPGNALARYEGAVLLVRAGKNAEAAAELQRLEGFAQTVPRVLYYQAMVAGRLRQAQSAEDLAQRYARRVPGDASGSLLLAQAEMGMQRPDLAMAALQKIQGDARSAPQVLDEMGTVYLAMGRVAEASESFERAASVAPDNSEIAAHRGMLEARTGGPGTGESLDRLEALAPGQPRTSETLVRVAMAAGEFERAGAALARLKTEVGDTEMVGILTGTLALVQLDPAGAERAFADTVRRFPASVNAKLNLARVIAQQGRSGEAAGMLAEVLAVDKGNLAALTSYVRLEVQEKQYAPALKALEAARAAAPDNAGLTVMQAGVLARSGDANAAVAFLKGAAAPNTSGISGRSPLLTVALANAQQQAGQIEEAKATLEGLAQAFPANPDFVRAKVELMARSNDLSGAKATLLAGLRRFPGDVGFMVALVRLESRSGGMEAALRMADEIRRDEANMPGAALLKGEMLLQANRAPEAAEALGAEYRAAPSDAILAALSRALTAAGREAEALTVVGARVAELPDDLQALHMLADLEVKGGQGEVGRRHLEKLLSKGGGDWAAMNNLAWLYLEGKDKRALPMARQAYFQHVSADTADTLGWVLTQTGSAGPAVPLLRSAVGERPDDPGMQYRLAVALKESGKREEAVSLLRPLAARPAFGEQGAARSLLESLAP